MLPAHLKYAVYTRMQQQYLQQQQREAELAESNEITLRTGLEIMNENSNQNEGEEQVTQQVDEEPHGDYIKENEGGEKVHGAQNHRKIPQYICAA